MGGFEDAIFAIWKPSHVHMLMYVPMSVRLVDLAVVYATAIWHGSDACSKAGECYTPTTLSLQLSTILSCAKVLGGSDTGRQATCHTNRIILSIL